MFKFFAAAFVGVASIWHGMFGTHAPANNNYSQFGNIPGQNRPANPNGSSVIGVVTSVSGTNLIVQAVQKPDINSASTTLVDFTVDASNARIIKSGSTTTSSVADIKIGDRVIAQGAVSGNSITAKLVIDTFPATQIKSNPQKSATTTPSVKTKKTTTTTTKTPVKKK